MSEPREEAKRIREVIHDPTWSLVVSREDILAVLNYVDEKIKERDTMILVGDWVRINDDEPNEVNGKVGKYLGDTPYPNERAIVDFGDGDVRSCEYYIVEKESNG